MPEEHLDAFIAKMDAAGLPRAVIDNFCDYYRQLASGETGLIRDADIAPVEPDEIAAFEDLEAYAAAGERAMPRAVMIVLNGGLGTTMGLTRAKSLMRVKDGLTFLEVIVRQATRNGVRLALMNSFSTHDDTLAKLAEIGPQTTPLTFVQHKYPKVRRDTLAPASRPDNPELEWNPPGHGDVYLALAVSGTLQRLLDEGVRYALIRNVYNLGASMNEALLGYFVEKRFPFMMEVARKTPSDVKGGHLARHRDGRLILRESAQCPETELDAFRDIDRYRFFNTNNIWLDLERLQALVSETGAPSLPIILNPKPLDPRDPESPGVYQIETAMGAAIGLFPGATAVRVPRARFVPVKSSNDLLAVRSDAYVFSPRQRLVENPERRRNTLKIRLDPTFFAHREPFNARIPVGGEPSLIDCESLEIVGDVRFEPGVRIVGRVSITNAGPEPAVIRRGTVVEGNLEV